MDEHQWHLNEMQGKNGANMEKSIHELQRLRSKLNEDIEMQVDKLLIKPLTEYQLLLSKVESLIKKRKNKLLDYDRHRLSLKKMTENRTGKSDMNEEKKIIKQEQATNQATMEYERYNMLLKKELPRLLELRSELLKPGVESLLTFQRSFYLQSAEIFSGTAFSGLTKKDQFADDPAGKYASRVEPILLEIRGLALFNGVSIMSVVPPSNASSSSSLSAPKYPSPSSPPAYNLAPLKNGPEQLERMCLDPPHTNPPASNQQAKKPPAPKPKGARKVRALYDFDGQDGEDLPFKADELIEVVDSSDQYGWWVGRLNGRTGNFPSNYVEH